LTEQDTPADPNDARKLPAFEHGVDRLGARSQKVRRLPASEQAGKKVLVYEIAASAHVRLDWFHSDDTFAFTVNLLASPKDVERRT
jgi:hypothetical protein